MEGLEDGELEEGEIPDEKDEGSLSGISDNDEVWDEHSQSIVEEHEPICHSKSSDTRLRQASKSDTSSIVEDSTRKAPKSEGKGRLLKKWLLSQSGFQEDKDQWTCGPEDMILWHGRKVSVGKAASELPEELFLAFEGDLNKLLQLSSFGGIKCDTLMAVYKEKLPSSAKEFKRIVRMNSCSSTTLVKICFCNLREKFEIVPKRCWNDDREQSSLTSVIQRKNSRGLEKQFAEEEEDRECSSSKDVMVIATKVIGKVKWFDPSSGRGLVTRDDNKEEIFVHQTDLIDNTQHALWVGEIVVFDVVIKEKRIKATNVSRCAGAPQIGVSHYTDHKEGQGEKNQIGRGVVDDEGENAKEAMMTRENANKRRRRKSSQTRSQSVEKKRGESSSGSEHGGRRRQRSGKSKNRRSTKRRDKEIRSRERKGSESSHSREQKRSKGSRRERSSSSGNSSSSSSSSSSGSSDSSRSSASSSSRKRKRSSSSEQRSRSSKERESESSSSSSRRRSKSEIRLQKKRRKEYSEQRQRKETATKFPNKKKEALVTDAAIQRILRVSLD